MIFLSKSDTEILFDWPAAIACIQNAYAAQDRPESQPGRLVAHDRSAWIRCMPAIPTESRFMGTKQISRTRAGKLAYLITLFDKETGELEFVMDAVSITAMRTAATSAAALQCLTPGSSIRLAVLGSGLEASHHVEAIMRTRRIESMTVYSPTPANRQRFAERFSNLLGIGVQAAHSSQAAVAGATHIVAAARSQGEVPILFGSWLMPGAVVISVGSTTLTQRELDTSVIEAADIIVSDVPEELRDDTGDMVAAAKAGIATQEKLYSLHQLIQGAVPDELLAPDRTRLFKSVGAALQDVAFAELLANTALQQGVGTPLNVALHIKQSVGLNS